MARAKKKVNMTKAEVEAQRLSAHEEVAAHESEVQAHEEAEMQVEAEEAEEPAEEFGEAEPDASVVTLTDAAAEPKEEGEGEDKPADQDEEGKVANSVVKAKFKQRYIDNARANEISRKAAKRS